MGKVTYNQSGYRGSSMSERAREAYEGGEAPKSKWTKATMLAALEEWCEENDHVLDEDVEKMRKDAIWSRFFKWKSWHHTGKFANETDFYGIDEDAAEEASRPMTEAEMEARATARRIRIAEHEAAKAEAEAQERQRLAERARKIAEFKRATGFEFYSLNGFLERRRRCGQEVDVRLAKSGALIVRFDGFEFNLNDGMSTRAFLWHALALTSGTTKFDAAYDRIAAEVESMRAQLAEQARA